MSANSLYGGIFQSINFGALMSGQKIPKVDGIKEADRYPTPPNSEVVLLDSKDDTLLYIKSTDVNNYSTIKRCRYARKCNKHIHRMYGGYKGDAFNLQRLTEV